MTLPEPRDNWLEARANSTPDRIAIIHQDREYTYNELYTLSLGYASALETHYSGNSEDSRIAIILPNSVQFVSLIHAIMMIKGQMVLINARLTSEEIKWQLKQTSVDIIIVNGEYISKLNSIDDIPELINIDNIDNIEALGKQQDHYKFTPAEIDLADIFSFVFTSGTTGKPKIVPLTYGNHFWSAQSSAYHLGIDKDDIWLLTMPMYHLGGLAIIFRSCLYGTSILIHDSFDVDKVMNDIVDKNVTQVSVVPTMLRRMLSYLESQNKEWNHTLRVVLVGGAATPIDLIERSTKFNLPIFTTYGMTETSSQFATATPKIVFQNPQTVGRPLLFSKLKIFEPDEDGVGEIGVKGLSVMNGYYNNPTANDQSFSDGYFLTGDIGYVDEDNNLHVLQRRTDLIISGGENIYPREIEQVLSELPEVENACVIPQENSEWGQIPVAVLILSSKISVTKITDYLTSKLAKYKIPKVFYATDHFPRTSSGKITKEVLINKVKEDKLTRLD